MDQVESLKYLVEPVMFFYFTTLSIEVSAVQQLIRRKVCITENMPNCDGKASIALINASSPWIGCYNIIISLLTLIVGLWFGSWADKYGRKKLMVAPVIGSILSTINFIVASHFMTATPWCLMASAVIIGLTTGTLGITSTCYGIVSEVTSPQRLSLRIALMEAVTFTGGALGFLIVSTVLPRTSFITVFSIELFLHFCALFYVVKLVYEPERPRRPEMSRTPVLSLQHIVSMYRTVTRPREHNYRRTVALLIASSFVLSLGLAAGYQFTYTLLTSPPLSWNGRQYSLYHGCMMAVQGLVLVTALPTCLRCLRMKDTTTGLLGTLSRMLGLGCLSLATQSWMAYTSLGLFSMSEFAMPSVRSILSKIVGPNEKSQIFAFISAQQSIAFLLSAVLMVVPGSMTVFFPGFGMALASGLQLVPLASLLYLYFALDESPPPPLLCNEDQAEHLDAGEDMSTTS